MNTKVLIFPGGFQYVKNYLKYDGVDIWLKSSPQNIPIADYYIGHSAGASFILSNYDSIKDGTFILVNPLIRKRNIISFLWSWIKFFILEGVKKEHRLKRLVPIRDWPYGFKKVLELIKVDVLDIVQRIPKENIVIVRGNKDYYFCDENSVELIKRNDIKLIEIDAGHDWNEKMEETINSLTV
ncbi:MAG: hypothetical protein Q7S49_01035 [bacterium]|nr:hypothetical protein [bacterium]